MYSRHRSSVFPLSLAFVGTDFRLIYCLTHHIVSPYLTSYVDCSCSVACFKVHKETCAGEQKAAPASASFLLSPQSNSIQIVEEKPAKVWKEEEIPDEDDDEGDEGEGEEGYDDMDEEEGEEGESEEEGDGEGEGEEGDDNSMQVDPVRSASAGDPDNSTHRTSSLCQIRPFVLQQSPFPLPLPPLVSFIFVLLTFFFHSLHG